MTLFCVQYCMLNKKYFSRTKRILALNVESKKLIWKWQNCWNKKALNVTNRWKFLNSGRRCNIFELWHFFSYNTSESLGLINISPGYSFGNGDTLDHSKRIFLSQCMFHLTSTQRKCQVDSSFMLCIMSTCYLSKCPRPFTEI